MRVRMLPILMAVAAVGLCSSGLSYAVGGSSGLAVQYKVQGQLGETVVNPYGLAPLTAVIRNGGYVMKHERTATG